VVPEYQTFQLTGVMTYAVAALGLNLITGYVGQVSLGHNAFFALGSYAAVLSVIYLGVGNILAVLIAAVVTFVAGVLAGYPAKRLRGLYLALITLILAVSVVPLIKQFKSYTHGAAGLLVDKPVPPAWFHLGPDAWIYYMVLMFAVIVFWLVRNFVGGSNGRALAGIREAELAASSMGVDVDRLRVAPVRTRGRGGVERAVRAREDEPVAGIDAARAIALAGMASVHILPVQAANGTETVAGALAGREIDRGSSNRRCR